MAITQADFNKIWASTSPLTPYEFSESQYKEGWNFVGGTPPSRQMWDFLQKQNDEKAQWLYLNVVQGIPIGVVQAYAGNTVPDGWLLCDGSAVSRTEYADLYEVVGDTYGAGDGSTTFNLPDLIDKFIEGSATSGTEHSAGLPNITGSLYQNITEGLTWKPPSNITPSGALTVQTENGMMVYAGGDTSTGYNGMRSLSVDASLSNSIYGNSDTVQPPSVTMRYIIKY